MKATTPKALKKKLNFATLPIKKMVKPMFTRNKSATTVADISDEHEEAIRICKLMLQYKNDHSIKDELSLHSPDCLYLTNGQHEMPAYEFFAAARDVFNAFPDFKFDWKRVVVVNKDTEHTPDRNFPEEEDEAVTIVHVEDFVASGHHTGGAYSYGPYPDVEAKGDFACDGPYLLTLWIRAGKIIRVKCCGKAEELCGPPKLYLDVGGLII